MVIRIVEEGKRITVPCPMGLARFAVRCIPAPVFDSAVHRGIDQAPEADREQAREQVAAMSLDKAMVLDILTVVADLAREFKGLELVHVEEADGTRVSITL